jgi:c-di-GMP-binding flagellar brake protein YcgR
MASSPSFDTGKWRIARSFPRFATDLVARVHLAPAGNERPPLLGRMVDIGLGGACVVVAEGSLGPREKVVIEFRFPMSLQALRLKASVRHCRKENRYGFQFLDLQPEEREKIRKACATLKIV